MNFLKRLQLNNLSISAWGYILVVLAIAAPWFIRPGYLFFTDNVWGPNLILNWTSSWFLFKFLIRILSFIFPIYFLEKVFIVGVIVLILLGGRRLVNTILEYCGSQEESGNQSPVSQGLIFILSLFVLFNPFVYDRALYGQFGVLVAYGCLLFVSAYLFRSWQSLDFKYLVQAAMFSAIALLFSVHFIFLLIPFYLLFLIGLFLKRRAIKEDKKIKKLGLILIFSVSIILVINANWLIALAVKASPLANFIEQGITSRDLVAFQTVGKNGPETLANVLLMSGFWGKEQSRYLDLTDLSGWQRSFILLAPLIFYGLYLSVKRLGHEARLFSFSLILIFTLAVFLAIGIKSLPTRGLTSFLYDHLPLYKGLREPQKWVALIIPIYLFYLTLGARRLMRTKIIVNNLLLSGFILGTIIIMQAPSLLWGFNRQVVPTSYPQDWHDVNSLLVNRSDQSCGRSDRILFLPWHMYMSFNWARKIIANPAQTFFACPVLSGTNMEWGGIYDNSRNSDSAIIANWINDKGRSGPPPISGSPIRYIILAKELDFISYLWLNDRPYAKPLLETMTLLVYEIKS